MADRDRINSYLQNIAEGESAFNDPRTEKEVFLANIANGDENTRNANTREEYWLKQIEGGGGNPNYVETIVGTLENPFGDLDMVSIAQKVENGDVTIRLDFEAENESWPLMGSIDEIDTELDYASLIFRYADFTTLQNIIRGRFDAALVEYEYEDGEVDFFHEPFVVINDATSSTSYSVDTDTPCTLSIIHHPLPSA